MRSLSLESIPVNKNMKLLFLLITLLVRTNPSLSKPTPNHHSIFNEIKEDLHLLKIAIDELKQPITNFSHTVKIQTPRDLKNACECEAPFVQHLKDALILVKEKLPIDEIANILDNLDVLHLPIVKKPNDNCHFTTHKLRDASLKNALIKDNIEFIENWNTNCKAKNH